MNHTQNQTQSQDQLYLERLSRRIAKLEKELAGLPEGELQISRSGKYYSWRIRHSDGSREYLPRENEALAALLVQKHYYQTLLKDLHAESRARERCLRQIASSASAVPALMAQASEEYKRLLSLSLRSRDERILAWENEPYEKSDKYPEGLIYPTFRPDEYVRSKIEQEVIAQAHALRIPYKYEKITQIGSERIAVDLTFYDARVPREVPAEIFGLMDDPAYRKSYRWKMSNYINNDYIPGINLLTFYESPSAPFHPGNVYEDLETYFFKRPPVIL